MVPVEDVPVVYNDRAIADLFLSDRGVRFRFSDPLAAYLRLSQELSRLAGKPILVVNLADLPHAYEELRDVPSNQPYTALQVSERASKLSEYYKHAFPGVDPAIWMKGDMAVHAASYALPNAGAVVKSCREEEPPPSILSPRMEGDVWSQAVIIFVPDRRWSDKAMWARRTGLSEDEIVKYPKGDGSKITALLHEMGHALQKGAVNDDTPDSVRCAYETNAINGEIQYGTILADDPRAPAQWSRSIRLTIALEAPVRAMARFLNAPEFYGTALAIDSHIKGIEPPSYEAARMGQRELRWRYYTTSQGIRGRDGELLSKRDNSRIIQKTIIAYWRRELIDPSLAPLIDAACNHYVGPKDRVSALRILHDEVINHPITNPHARSAAGLVLRAAKFFCPPIFAVRGVEHATRAEITRRPAPALQRDHADMDVTPSIPPWQIPARRVDRHL
jgi:hypothetical protein